MFLGAVCRFAREPERRKVGIDARVTIEGASYEVEPNFAGETVLLLWGLFDTELYVEFGGERFGPYHPVSGPILLNRYRAFKRSKSMERADKIRQLASHVGVPMAALTGTDVQLVESKEISEPLPRQPFDAQVLEAHFPNVVTAKLAIVEEL